MFSAGLTLPARALDDLPTETGWTGFVNFGLGVLALESNTVAGNELKTLGDDTIDSIFDAPQRHTEGLPIINAQVGYYWSRSRTKLFAGNTVEDLIRYEFDTRVAVHKGFERGDILGVELLFSGVPARVWDDPYVAGVERRATDRSDRGLRLTWDRIAGSGVEVEVSARIVRLDDEHSGLGIGLPAEDRALLDREGSRRSLRVGYRLPLSARHSLLPRVRLADYALDGDAMRHDRISLDVAHQYRSRKAFLVSTLYLGMADYGAVHPIYGIERADDDYGITFVGGFPTLLPGRRWLLGVTAAAYASNSNIRFYDARVGAAGVVAFYNF